jgi:hypothetical protein
MNTPEKIERLLHAVRSPDSTFDDLHELSLAMNKASQDELELAFRKYVLGLLGATIDVMKVQHAILERQENNAVVH